jgi:hypothetical protein
MSKASGKGKGTEVSTAIAARSGVVQAQQAAMHKMPEALRAVYQALREQQVGMVTDQLAYYRQFGEYVQQAASDENQYGAGAVRLLAKALDASPNYLYTAAAFFTTYSEAEYEALTAIRTATGTTLTWTHVVALLGVKDHAKRTKLQTQAARMGWSGEELRQAVMEMLGDSASQRRGNSGRKPVQPKSTQQGLRNLCVGMGDYMRRSEQVWRGFLDQAIEAPPDSIDAAILAQAESVVAAATRTATEAAWQLGSATALRDRYRAVLQAKDNLSTEDEDAEDEDEDEDADASDEA